VWRYTYVNQRAADILGRSAESLLGQYLWDLFPEGVGQPFYEACGDAKARQTPVAAELYYNEQAIWLESRIYPSADGLSILFQDITERRHAADALQQQLVILRQRSEEERDRLVAELKAERSRLAAVIEQMALGMQIAKAP